MVLQERGPALITTRLAWRSLRHVLAYRPRRHADPELDQQLIGNSLLAPQWILCAIRRIKLRSSGGIGGRPALHFRRQKIRQPIRCQRTTVDGRTLTTAARQSNILVNSARLTRVA
jgi:hypothetical protein